MKDEGERMKDEGGKSEVTDENGIASFSSFRLHPSSFPPPPPWELEGAAVVLLHSWRSILALVRYDCSPVGSYEELAVATLTLHGPTVVKMIVNSTASLLGGRQGWGFPKELGQLRWKQHGRRIRFVAGARVYRVRLSRFSFP